MEWAGLVRRRAGGGFPLLGVAPAKEVTTTGEPGRTAIDPNHTRLRFVHHLDEQAKPEEVGPGWEYYLDALLASIDGGSTPVWDDYWPSLSSAYADQTSARPFAPDPVA